MRARSLLSYHAGLRAVAAWVAALALVACGGGGGGPVYTSIPPPPPGAVGVNPLALNAAGTILSGIVPTAASGAVLGLVSVQFPAPTATPGTVFVTGKAGATAAVARAANAAQRTGAASFRAGARPHALAVRAMSSPPPVGTHQSFYVGVTASRGGPVVGYTSYPFTLVSTSAHTAVWIQDSNIAEFAPASSTFANDAETAYAADTAAIGQATYTDAAAGRTANVPYCDSAGNPAGSGPRYAAPFGYLNVLMIDANALGQGVGGEFEPVDTNAQASLNCTTGPARQHSNEGGFIVAALSPSANVHYHVQQFLAHEFAHLIQFVNQVIVLGRPNAEPPAINEGVAELARDITLGTPDIGNISGNTAQSFLPRPQDYSILGMTGAQGYYGGGNYGGAYLLMRYIADRYGYGFVKTYVQSDPLTSTKSSYDALAAAAGAPSFAALFRDFGATLAASAAGLPPQAPYAFASIQFAHTYQNVQTNDASAATVTIPAVGTAGTAAFADNRPFTIYPGGITLLNVPNPVPQAQLYVTDATKTLGLDGVIASH